MVCSSGSFPFLYLKKDKVELKKLQRRVFEMFNELPLEEKQDILKLQFAGGRLESDMVGIYKKHG